MQFHLRNLIVIALLATGRLAAGEPLFITQAHAHNDYQHARPLLDALDHGFCSVEADIFLVQGKFLVAHEMFRTKPERSLQALYLDPLRERVKKNGGRVYPNGPEFTLLIELKQDWRTSYPALRSVLTNYSDILVSFADGMKQSNAILVVITGKRDEKMFAGETVRYATVDGEVGDLDRNPPATLVPWISANWKDEFHWNGTGTMPDAELRKLQALVSRAHQQMRRVRFWGAPDRLAFWRTLRAQDVDLINTDDLAGVENFFKESSPKE